MLLYLICECFDCHSMQLVNCNISRSLVTKLTQLLWFITPAGRTNKKNIHKLMSMVTSDKLSYSQCRQLSGKLLNGNKLQVRLLCPTRHKIDHFRDFLRGQSLGALI